MRMIEENAQLARVYFRAYQVTGSEFYKRVTTEILDYVAREMTSRAGASADGFCVVVMRVGV